MCFWLRPQTPPTSSTLSLDTQFTSKPDKFTTEIKVQFLSLTNSMQVIISVGVVKAWLGPKRGANF